MKRFGKRIHSPFQYLGLHVEPGGQADALVAVEEASHRRLVLLILVDVQQPGKYTVCSRSSYPFNVVSY